MSTKLGGIGGLLLLGGCTVVTGVDSLTVEEPAATDVVLPARPVEGPEPIADAAVADASAPADASSAIDASTPADASAVDAGPPFVACGDNGIPGDRSTLYKSESGKVTVVEVCAKGCEWTEGAANDHCRTSATCLFGVGLYCGGNGVSGAKDVLFRCTTGKIVPETRCTKGCQRRSVGDNDRCYP